MCAWKFHIILFLTYLLDNCFSEGVEYDSDALYYYFGGEAQIKSNAAERMAVQSEGCECSCEEEIEKMREMMRMDLLLELSSTAQSNAIPYANSEIRIDNPDYDIDTADYDIDKGE